MPLKVVLRPGERMVVNGAVLGAGDRAATLFLHNQAQFLRSRDMLRPEQATCAARRFYLAIQTLYLAAPAEAPAATQALREAAAAAEAAAPEAGELIRACLALAEEGACYPAMRRCARLFEPAPATAASAPPASAG